MWKKRFKKCGKNVSKNVERKKCAKNVQKMCKKCAKETVGNCWKPFFVNCGSPLSGDSY